MNIFITYTLEILIVWECAMEHKVCNSFNNVYEASFCITTFIDFVSDFLGGKGISISFCMSCLYLAMNVIRIRER